MSNKKTKCVLPSEESLKKNGFGELVKIMKMYPEKFAHIRQDKNPKTGESKNGK